jgi:predicted dehydrogenase
MLKVGIVGCGKIADIHASQIRRIPECEIVGVCDHEELMARQLAERLNVRNSFGEVRDMLRASNPDVVHVTTPPQSHFDIAKLCLEHGSHVYVEKPFTLHAWEAEELIARANANELKVTVGHDAQYSHATRRMRQLVLAGYLGGPPVHMESLWCYQLGGHAYAKAFLGGKGHWVRRLPGGLLQNIISHGISKIAEFLTTESPDVLARGFVSAHLQSLGEHEIFDELRVVISEGDRTTAYFTFSSQMRPCLHHFRIFGPINGLILDEDQQIVLKLRGARYKSYLERFVPSIQFAGQHIGNFSRNLSLFLNRDFHMEAGMKCLIETFYRSIDLRQEVPIPYREIVLTARIMDNIFQQLNSQRSLTESNLCTVDSV